MSRHVRKHILRQPCVFYTKDRKWYWRYEGMFDSFCSHGPFKTLDEAIADCKRDVRNSGYRPPDQLYNGGM